MSSALWEARACAVRDQRRTRTAYRRHQAGVALSAHAINLPGRSTAALPARHAQPAPTRRGVSVCVRASDNPYEQIKANRAARKKAAAEAEEEEEELPQADLACQAGDIVEVSWECADTSTGAVIDSSTKGGIPRNMSFQMGTDAGFQPKNGLKLAFNYVCGGLAVGEEARVVSRPSGKGWFKAYEVLSEDGQLLAQLNPEERGASWADTEALFTVEVVKITPPRGRARGGRRG